ncbi:hypothetical protein LEP1GSC088_0799 [Leptospira interrogans str. L1207]|nr:hypothetical protein LEP1GSC088_0799 [Leptospira interrogans str. L1207]
MSQAWIENTILDCILKECYLCSLKITNKPVVSLFAGTGVAASVDVPLPQPLSKLLSV